MTRKPSNFKFGPFCFDTSNQELRQRGRRVRFSVSLLKLLTLFLDHPGELVTREQIADALWEDQATVDTSLGINSAVRRLRAILEDDQSSPQYIETVIGLGYRFIAEIEECEAAESGPASFAQDEFDAASGKLQGALTSASPAPGYDVRIDAVQTASGAASATRSRLRRRLVGFVLAAALLVAAVGIVVSRHRPTLPAAVQQPPALKPESAQIAFSSEDDRIDAEAVSPDGRVVAYSSRSGISIHSLDSGVDQLLTSPPSFLAQRIAWYPDENGLAVSGVDPASHRRLVWSVFLHGQPPHLLVSDAGMATLSPDGNSVAYTRKRDSEIWVAEASGENPRRVVPNADGEYIAALLWSPQGNRLVFDRVTAPGQGGNPPNAVAAGSASYESVDARTGKQLSQEQNIRFDSGLLLKDGRLLFTVNGAQGSSRLMVAKTDPDTGRFLSGPEPATQPAGWNLTTAAAPESLSASANGEIFGAVLPVDAIDVYWADILEPGPTLSGATRLTGELVSNYPHAWSPSGDAVVFDGNNGVCKQRLGEPKLQILAKPPETAAMANFSPDGEWVLFAEYAGLPGHVIGIFSVPAGGGNPRQLPTTGAIDEFHCSVSFTGRCVMRETIDKEFVFYALDPVAGMGQELARTNWKSTVIGDWSVSPDGSTVAMADHDPDHPAFTLIPLAPHGSKTAIPVHGYGVVRESTWAADGKGFYVETKTASGFDLLYVNRAGHANILRKSLNSIWGIPSRDGKRLAFPSPNPRTSVWVGRTSLAMPGS